MIVVWSDRALKSLSEIHGRISAESEERAHSVVDGILRRGDQLSAFPQSGRRLERFTQREIRELVEGAYRIIYRVRPGHVQVIDVFHAARRPPWER